MFMILAFIASKAEGQAIHIQDLESGQTQPNAIDALKTSAMTLIAERRIVGGAEVLTKEEY